MNGFAAANRRNSALSKYISALLIASASVMGAAAHAQTVPPKDAKPLCAVSPQIFATWFVNGNVTANGAVNPANSVTFPSGSDCDFHQWSEHMFLWLTSAATSYGGSTPVFNSPVFYTVSSADPTTGKRTYTQNKSGEPLPLVNVRTPQQGPHRLQIFTDKNGHEFEILPATLAADGQSEIHNAAGKLVEIHRLEVQNGKAVFFDTKDKKIALPKVLKMDTAPASRVAPMLAKLESADTKNMVQGLQIGKQTVFIDSAGNVIEPSQGQAGGGAVLLPQTKDKLVYYSTVVNDVFAYFQTGMANNAFPPKMVSANLFPTTADERDAIVAYAKKNGAALPDADALAMEIKMSWVDAAILGEQAKNYVTVPAIVPVYDTQNPQLWKPKTNAPITLALVGMHVVGSAHNHPEMIWATFEHLSNTPNAQFTYTNVQNQTIEVAQSTAGSWLFAGNNAPAPYNMQKAVYKSPNISGSQVDPKCDPNKQPCEMFNIEPSNTIRWKAWGTGSDASNVTLENTEVISTNNTVRSQLATGDLRSNYIFIGSTWTNSGQTVETTNQLGSTFLCNTTMETYDQGANTTGTPQNPNVQGNNCFGCHNNTYPKPAQPPNQKANTKVSHIFSDMIPLFK